MKKHLLTACLYTAITAVLLGIVYPLAVAAVSRVLFPAQASGELVVKDGTTVGSKLIGQAFTGPNYFHSRPSAAGNGYDASNSSGSNLAPTSKALVDRVDASVKSEQGLGDVPVDLVTASASGLDPDITPAAAFYQVERVATARHMPQASIRALITAHTTDRQFGLLGEPRVNVLALNMALDAASQH
jgi:K+-transporting ATPase ATPase C chain